MTAIKRARPMEYMPANECPFPEMRFPGRSAEIGPAGYRRRRRLALGVAVGAGDED